MRERRHHDILLIGALRRLGAPRSGGQAQRLGIDGIGFAVRVRPYPISVGFSMPDGIPADQLQADVARDAGILLMF